MKKKEFKMINKEEMAIGYIEMAHINLSLQEDAMLSESSPNYNDGGKYNA